MSLTQYQEQMNQKHQQNIFNSIVIVNFVVENGNQTKIGINI